MRYWLINANSRSVKVNFEAASFTLITRRRPRLAAKDRVLFLENRPAVFAHSAVIESVDSTGDDVDAASTVEASAPKLTTYLLSELREIAQPLSLAEARFSLTIVRNISVPGVHFRRAYRLLPITDFQSIEERHTFVARTGYFELLNSLPDSLRLLFRSEQVLLPEPDSYRERLHRLHDFLDTRVFAAGRMLRSIKQAVEALDLLGEDGRPLSHLFSNGPDDAVRTPVHHDELDAQVQRFQGLDKLLEVSPPADGQKVPRDAIALTLVALGDDKINRIEKQFEQTFKRLR